VAQHLSVPVLRVRSWHLTIDLGTGVYMRTERLRLLFGATRPDQADGYDVSVDWPWTESVLEIAVARFPWLAGLPLDRAAS
jgi:sarcosine oxidase, subunit beta